MLYLCTRKGFFCHKITNNHNETIQSSSGSNGPCYGKFRISELPFGR